MSKKSSGNPPELLFYDKAQDVREIYAETLSNLEQVVSGSARLYEIFFYSSDHDLKTIKVQCQSLFCFGEVCDDEIQIIERIELIADAHSIDKAKLIARQFSNDEVQKMRQKLFFELYPS